MLLSLRIQNIILIEAADIPFGKGFNVLSGETGAGKSAILNALNLITGDRTDTTLIRRGADKGTAEATFSIEENHQVTQLLERIGVVHHAEEDLILRREVLSSGKSRAFINSQQVPLNVLRETSSLLLEMVGQHANQKLLDLEWHRSILDDFAGLQDVLSAFASSWQEENAVKKQIEELISNEAQRLRDIDVCQMEIEELQSAHLKEQEDEELFAEYTLLSNAEELSGKTFELSQILSEGRQAVLPQLCRQQQSLHQIVKIDSTLEDAAKAFDNIIIELNEIAHTIRNYHSRIEHNHNRTEEVNERLKLIDRLKRRYGNTIAEIQTYEAKVLAKLQRLQNCDTEIEELKNKLQELEKINTKLCRDITARRQKAASQLEQAITKELHSLNMPKADFHCSVTPKARSTSGDDNVEFFLAPNVGEHRISIRNCASGGELSRVMLALQTLLAGKGQIPCLVFDEIDSNIGGETASVVGEKLKQIGKELQVICITHFPQVAKEAEHHLQIAKKEHGERTVTFVTLLNPKMRKQELIRMLGGKVI